MVPVDYKDSEGRALGAWVHHQRNLAKQGLLQKDREAQLGKVGMDWDAGSAARFSRLTMHGAKESESRSLPKRKTTLLHRLFSSKKGFKANKSKSSEEFGPDGDDQWVKYVQALKDYQKEFGNCDVPRSYVDDNGCRLGEWVSYQRVRNAGKTLQADKEGELAALGFVWDLQLDDDLARNGPTAADVMDDWDSCKEALAKYKGANGDCMVPRKHVTKKKLKLGAWVSNVRDVAAQNELPPDKRDELSALGFHWESPRGDGYGLPGGCGHGRWEAHFDSLVKYKTEHGDCAVPSTYMDNDGRFLGAWVANQRHRAFNDELPFENRDRLSALRFDWKTQQLEKGGSGLSVWDKHMQSIVDYKAEHGETNIPPTFEDKNGIGLGSWCTNQRQLASHNRLGADKRKELIDLGFDLNLVCWHGNLRGSTLADGQDQRGSDYFGEEESLGSSVDPQMNVHKCASAYCEQCQVGARDSVTFVSLYE